jgi:hypothetical protein
MAARAVAKRPYSSAAFRDRGPVRDPAGVGKDVPLGQPEAVVQLGDPVGRVHRSPVEGLHFGELEVRGPDLVGAVEFLGAEIVFAIATSVFLGAAPSSWSAPCSA